MAKTRDGTGQRSLTTGRDGTKLYIELSRDQYSLDTIENRKNTFESRIMNLFLLLP